MLLRELLEQTQKTAVLAFGRLNPPTIGHAKLVDKLTRINGDHYLFLSQTQHPKTDPLDFPTKLKFAKQFFSNVNVGHESVRTAIQALELLQSQGYTDIIFVAGSDRVEGFQKLFDTYNGQPDKTGKVPFKFNSIRVISAGERDPDAEGAEGMSASKMRAAAASGNLQAFAQGVPDKKLAQTMYDAVRRGMGISETTTKD
jgi:citrate lyase synthetase